MAYAARNVWLEPEEHAEQAAQQVRTRTRRAAAPALWQRPVQITLAVAFIVAVLITYISGFAHNASLEFQRRALEGEITRLSREQVQLSLEIDRLSAQPVIARRAQELGLEHPGAEQVHYVQTAAVPKSIIARTSPESARPSWFANSGHQIATAVQGTVQRLGGGATEGGHR